jgi:hypothetical protein
MTPIIIIAIWALGFGITWRFMANATHNNGEQPYEVLTD